MLYRPVTSLTDEEITYIVNDLFHPDHIEYISRNSDPLEPQVQVCFQTTLSNNSHDLVTLLDTVILTDPFQTLEGIYSNDDSIDDEIQEAYKKFCIAKGVCYLLKNNPYIS